MDEWNPIAGVTTITPPVTLRTRAGRHALPAAIASAILAILLAAGFLYWLVI